MRECRAKRLKVNEAQQLDGAQINDRSHSFRSHWHCVGPWQLAAVPALLAHLFPLSLWPHKTAEAAQHELLGGLHSHMRCFIITEEIWERPASQSVQLEAATWSGAALICYQLQKYVRKVRFSHFESHQWLTDKVSFNLFQIIGNCSILGGKKTMC